MSSNWIKVEVITPDKPEVCQFAELLDIDPDAALGKLIRLWAWADQQTVDGKTKCNAVSVTKNAVDRITFVKGFADALISIGLLIVDDSTLKFPNFERHNGNSSKKRVFTNQRVTKSRKMKLTTPEECNAESVTPAFQKALPEIEREEDIKDNPLSSARVRSLASGHDPSANNAVLDNRPPSPGWFGPIDKFTMHDDWLLDEEFSRKAATWGIVLDEPPTATELAEFITFWKAEGKAKHHAQWEQALTKSIRRSREFTGKRGKDGKKVKQYQPTRGHAVEKIRAAIAEEREREGLPPLEYYGDDILGSVDGKERHDPIIDLESGDWQVE
ncbi:conserved hypothetical protein [Sodalis glossinidius str. 'morsitans']|uniref:DnaT DNA-binding domain-containing protein n=2 Tax=Sodalis glossinidius TaxID=63612 RepID=Q2NTN9_SODGM|nr:DnaT-like ssDNA-binding domain-containing protein [Sodalis glossinidius]BAE74486.1 conserved hypothetical protein [Sodalis glossinidius str. 'morsitans']